MDLVVIVAVIIVILAVLSAVKTKQISKSEGLSFERRDPLFSPAERSFLGVLEQAIDDKYRVFGKVRLGDIVRPAKGLSNSKRAIAHNKLFQKHVDFVVCSVADLAVVGVVELDDQSHEREDRAGRDAFVDQALTGAKIPIVHFSAKRAYPLQEIRTKLTEAFQQEPAAVTTDTIQSVDLPPPPVAATPVTNPSPQPEEKIPSCPNCTTIMVKRQAKTGPHAGKTLLGMFNVPEMPADNSDRLS